MSDHAIEILAFLDRATGVCSCGFSSGEKFGDRRTAAAKHSLMVHIEAAASEESDEYQIRDGQELKCPKCKAKLDLANADKGILSRSEPSVVTCTKGDQFDAYYQKSTLFLFAIQDGPFSTT